MRVLASIWGITLSAPYVRVRRTARGVVVSVRCSHVSAVGLVEMNVRLQQPQTCPMSFVAARVGAPALNAFSQASVGGVDKMTLTVHGNHNLPNVPVRSQQSGRHANGVGIWGLCVYSSKAALILAPILVPRSLCLYNSSQEGGFDTNRSKYVDSLITLRG